MTAAEPEPSPGSQDLTGTRVGRFAIRALLGTGGMGEVYRAEDTRLMRPVALKRVQPKLGADPRAREHILKEAERASALKMRGSTGGSAEEGCRPPRYQAGQHPDHSGRTGENPGFRVG